MDNNKTTPQQAAANAVAYLRAANSRAASGPTISEADYSRAQRDVEQRLKRIAKS